MKCQGLERYLCSRVFGSALLAAATLYMGIHPKPFTDVMDASVAHLLQHVAHSKLP